MAEDTILIDFNPNDYIIRLSPFLDKKGDWTGELMVGTSIPAMEDDDDVRQVLADIVDTIQEDLKDTDTVEDNKVIDVNENVINVKFN